MYLLGYNSLVELADVPCRSRFVGSGSLRSDGDLIWHKKRMQRELEITGNIYRNYLTAVNYSDMLCIQRGQLSKYPDAKKIANYDKYVIQYQDHSNFLRTPIKREKTSYKINKAKVRKRLTALCRLSKSKQFLAFYSVSFPVNTNDEAIYLIFNKWLTNCRKRYGLNTYIWVAERQSNGTLHFHILTNDRMNIYEVNKAMANSIDTSVNQGLTEWGASSRSLYNGVDVDSIQRPKQRQYETREQYRKRIKAYSRHTIHERIKWATMYMTKYMTKNDDVFTHLPYHCSRDISQLFTGIQLSDKDITNFITELSDNPDDYEIKRNDRITLYVFKTIQSDKVYRMLDKLNNWLYEHYRIIPEKPPEIPPE